MAYTVAMNVERCNFENEETPEEAAGWDARIEAATEAARKDPRYAALFEPFDEAAADARAEADIAAGRVYTNEEVIAWLKTWGKPDRKPLRRRWSE